MNIILVPGFTASVDTLHFLRTRLEAEGHVCYGPGFNWNTLVNGEFQNLIDVINGLCGQVVLIGHSAGGLLSVLAADTNLGLDVAGVIGLGSAVVGRVDLDVPYYEARSLIGWLLPLCGADEVKVFPIGHAGLPMAPCVQKWVLAKVREINAQG